MYIYVYVDLKRLVKIVVQLALIMVKIVNSTYGTLQKKLCELLGRGSRSLTSEFLTSVTTYRNCLHGS